MLFISFLFGFILFAIPSSLCQYSPSNQFNVLVTSSMMGSYPLAGAYENYTGFPAGTVNLIRSVSSARMGDALANPDAYKLPRIDAVLGLDNMVELLTAEHFISFTLNNRDDIYDPIFQLGDYTHLKPFDFGLISLVYDPKVSNNIHTLRSNFTLEMLSSYNLFPETILINPLKSTAGLGFFMWVYTIYGDKDNNIKSKFPEQSGTKDYKDWWKNAFQSGVGMADSWSKAYYGRFLNASDPIKLISSYGSSDAYGYCNPSDKTGILSMVSHAPDGSSYAWAQVEGMAVVNTTLNITESEKFMNYLFTPELQQEIFLNQYMYPANEKKTVAAPDCWQKASPIDPWQVTILNRQLNDINMEIILPKVLAEWEKLYKEYYNKPKPVGNGSMTQTNINGLMIIATAITTIIAVFKLF